MAIEELRVVLTVPDFEQAVALYRDALGAKQRALWEADGAHAMLLDAGRATIELADEAHAAAVDSIEVGRRMPAQVRIALQVADSEATADRLRDSGAELLGGPVVTPWRDRNVRLRAPDGVQLTLFTVLDT
jgi:lactoylglutathione lyase